MSNHDESVTPGRRSKVLRLLTKYNLGEIGDQLVDRWTASGDDRMSLRALAEYFNHAILRAAMAESGLQPLDGEVANTYRLLTDDEVTEADRMRAQRRLEREGVDVDELRRDFVTYQAIRTYLTEYREVSYSEDTPERTAVERTNIQQLRGRLLTVTDSKLDQLRRNDTLDLGTYRTFVDVTVLCEDCGERYDVDDLLDTGGCACDDETA